MQAICDSQVYHFSKSVSSESREGYNASAMPADRKLGNYFARLAAERLWNISELARRASVTRPTMYRYLRGKTIPEVDKRRSIAVGFGFTGEDAGDRFDDAWMNEPPEATPALIDLLAAADTTPLPPPAPEAKRRGEGEGGARLRDLRRQIADVERAEHDNVDRPPRRAVSIPEWEAEVAAGNWIDCISAQLDANAHGEVIDRGMFIIRVRGDSMMPDYPPGCRVLFRIVRLGDEPLIVGEDYCFQNSDGQCTLKRLHSVSDLELVLAPVNRKYKPLVLPKDTLVRASIVEGVLTRPAAKPRK